MGALVRLRNGFAAAALGTLAGMSGLSAETPKAPESLTVQVDHAKVIRLPERASTVIVGNPAIADLAVQPRGVVVVTGKAYGVTNLIAMDAAGNLLAESLIQVQAPTAALVTVQRGLDRASYSCTPNCQPTVILGDENKFFSEASAQTGARNQLATPQR